MAPALLPRCAGLADTRSRAGPRILILLLSGLVAAAVVWAGWATVEQIVRATGQVEPAARVQVVNHPRGGRVAELLVAEGDAVRRGEVLARLDPELDDSALDELEGRLAAAQVEVARLEAELAGARVDPPRGLVAARPDLVAEATALAASRRHALERRLAQLASTERQRAMELEEQRAQIRRLETTLALLKEEADAVNALAAKGLAPRLERVALQRRVADAEGELAVAERAAAAAHAAIDEAEASRARVLADRESELREQLTAARAAFADLQQKVARQRKLVGELDLRAPVHGIVKDVAITNPGQSFAAHAPLMRVVPTGGPLLVEAQVPQREVGRIHVGQNAVVKVMALDYLRFGELAGEIVRIAADANTDERTGETTYTAVVATDRATLERAGVTYPLVPGMLVDVELHVGERSILSYLTDRILMLSDQAFREG
jgi:HlyD family type I secretion membrane fusion protein